METPKDREEGMSKSTALRTLKRERELDVSAYVAAVRPDLRVSSKVRRVLNRRKAQEMRKP